MKEKKSLMTENIYNPAGTVLIAGACLDTVEPEGYSLLAEQADAVYSLCLEETHLNMAVTKISAILSTGRVTRMLFASVDRPPHCTQMHYIPHEVERTLKEHAPIENYVVTGGKVIRVSNRAIELSKTLAKLTEE
ncbi:MAG: hypothetical protein IJI38_00105 [Clostridia bacterium]|nr:hypothetical protein [Clostridia bacterium]